LHTDCPRYVNAKHAACASKEHCSTFVAGHYQSNDRAGDERPRGVAKVDHGLSVGICIANHGENFGEIVSMCIRNLLRPKLPIKQDVVKTHEISVLPDHCVNMPMADARYVLLLIPGVLNMSIQDCFAASNSSLIVVSIWVNSAQTNTEFLSPSA
jgi:hypothetical protein